MCPLSRARSENVVRSQRRRDWSRYSLPLASVLPSGLNTRATTASVCPESVADELLSATSQRLIKASPPPLARVCPSLANANDRTALLWPFNVEITLRVRTFQSRIDQSY